MDATCYSKLYLPFGVWTQELNGFGYRELLVLLF